METFELERASVLATTAKEEKELKAKAKKQQGDLEKMINDNIAKLNADIAEINRQRLQAEEDDRATMAALSAELASIK